MNVYDFDDTIYDGDSSKDFIVYIIFHHPFLMLKELPMMIIFSVLYLFGEKDKKQMKSRFFHFLSGLNGVDYEVKRFWDVHEIKIKKWYLLQKQKDDVIISASPEFLLKEICNRLEITNLIATNIDIRTGQIKGENCKNKEKVVRFYEVFPNTVIECFYSDSKTDCFLAKRAQKAYYVKKDIIIDWDI